MSLRERASKRELAGPEPKILFIDVERRAGLAFVYDQRIRGGFIPVRKWVRRPSNLCFSAAWYHKPPEFFAIWESDDPHYLARESWALVDAADVVVTYFGTRADLPWLRSGWKAADLGEPSPFVHLDLHRIGTKFGYPSSSLAELCHQFGLPGKQGKFDEWDAEKCVEGDEKVRARMRRYSLGDVSRQTLQGVFDELRPWIRGVNFGLYAATAEEEVRACPNCGNTKLEPAGFAATAVTRYPAYRCTNPKCRTLMRGKNRSASVPMRTLPR